MLNQTFGSPFEVFIFLSAVFVIFAFTITVHEASHAWMANRLGDPTAKHLGRLTLNPVAHIDPLGTLILPLILIITQAGIIFGWAKPTPFNPFNLKNPRQGGALISLAGPASNFLIAFALGLIFRATQFNLIIPILELNLILGVFNLIPIPPLDGFRIVGGILPKETAYQWLSLEKYGIFLMIFLLLFLLPYLSPFISQVLNFFIYIFAGI
ncbi:MAG: hypothetical protein A2Y57_01350 [Candidatus Woykebacteria bacterium RBG_13_40_7b]|uniref:Peptidase M50 domain-containing protein n=1 Tax=Candidatus Woykebacteria bacterium RBG_13_40_7b TaxID=1802594 RepID=A0A1G1WA02_9BACT|nr:MAG: hypothetical protein A2Y57_01350 [Candidatus Woykebacteria bacterium RBG_13_40_7b]